MAKMVSVKVSSTTDRKQIVVSSEASLAEVFAEAKITASGDMTITVNGVHSFKTDQLSVALKDISGIDLDSQITVMAVVNSKNA